MVDGLAFHREQIAHASPLLVEDVPFEAVIVSVNGPYLGPPEVALFAWRNGHHLFRRPDLPGHLLGRHDDGGVIPQLGDGPLLEMVRMGMAYEDQVGLL